MYSDQSHIQAFDHDHSHWDYPSMPDVTTDNCVASWPANQQNPPYGSFPYSAAVSLDVPLPSETLLLLSEGSLSSGDLKITTSPEVSGAARVHIVVYYYNQDTRDKARICLIDRKRGESGVGILVRRLS